MQLRIATLLTASALLVALAAPALAGSGEWTTNGPYGGYVWSITAHPDDNQHLYAGTLANFIFETTDGGENWTPITTESPNYNARGIKVHPFGPDTIFCATDAGVYKSSDAGRTWKYRILDHKQALFSIAAIGGRAITVGEKGLIRFSDDGGDSWEPPREDEFPTVFTFMRDLGFERERRMGLIVGQEGMVMRSLDGGQSWSQVLPPEGWRRRI